MGRSSAAVVIIGGGVVGTAVAYTLAHCGVETVLLEADAGLAYAASGTNSGILHTGFDSISGELETALIRRAEPLRDQALAGLGLPVLRCGAVLEPRRDEDRETIAALAAGARANGVGVSIRDDGALVVPGESVTDPVAFTQALAASAVAAGARIELGARVVAIEPGPDGLSVRSADGNSVDARLVINCAGLYADEIARLVGDESFAISPRKGEFFVFELPEGARLDHILLPVPTKRTKGVLVFPSLDGRVIAGPTAVDCEDKTDWSVRPEAASEILPKAVEQFSALEGLEPIDSYTGLRPAGRGSNYVIGPSAAEPRLINVAAIRSTGLTASLGIAAYVAELVAAAGVEVGPEAPPAQGQAPIPTRPWWQRTAHRYRTSPR